MKKKFSIYIALAICLLFQSPSYTRSQEYEELQRFLDDFHRINLGNWVPEFSNMHLEFNQLLKLCPEKSTQKMVRVWDRFIAMSMRYYATPEIKAQLFKEAFEVLGKENETIQSSLSTINDVDDSWLLMPLKKTLIAAFQKETLAKELPTADVPEMIVISNKYEQELEKLCSFLDRFHAEKLDSSVSSPDNVCSSFNDGMRNMQKEFEDSHPAEDTEKPHALYTFKIDVCRAYTRFIPIVMQYYCDEELIEAILKKAFEFLDEIDPFNIYSQANTLLDSTQIMINAMNSIGKVGGGVGKVLDGVRGLLKNKFKKTLK